MTIHLVKLCVGANTVDDLKDWVDYRVEENKAAGLGEVHDHITRMFPRRRDDVLDDGALYWVIKGVILVRQKILDLRPIVGKDGVERCAILLDPPLIPTEAHPRKAFQGWRYLSVEDAPRDLRVRRKTRKGGKKAGRDGEEGDERAQAALHAELAALGLL
ncbi:MAG: DUF1489 domain-containing protein [Pseudomonadota bacterium]